MEIYANQRTDTNSVQFSTHNARRDTFTFLKSNYKYKRRNLESQHQHQRQHQSRTASQCRGNAINRIGIIATDTDDSATAAECNSINKVIKDTWTSWRQQKMAHNAYAAILRMLLLIMSNSKRLPSDDNSGIGKQHITKGNAITINASSNDDVNVDSNEMDFQRNDVKVLTATSIVIVAKATTTLSSSLSPRSSMSSTSYATSPSISSVASFTAPATVCSSSASLSSTSSTTTTTKSTLSTLLPVATDYSALRISDKLFTFFAALFIAFAFCARSVAAGACWQTALDNGKCNEIFSLNITKAECCGRSQEFSYTERDLTEVEYFFATAIGGGMECAPCIESCKHIECGANKKCVKRKGRPKCICAPECGAAARRRRQHQNQQLQQQQQQHYRGHLHHSEQLPRDIRSLSSEITNFNLGLDTRGDVGANNGANNANRRNQNQRKMLILQSQSQNQRHHHHQQQQQKQSHHNQYQAEQQQQVKTGKRVVIIANVDPNELKQQSTTRRIQVISNVVKGHRGRNAEATSLSTNSSWSTTSLNADNVRRPLKSRHKNNTENCNVDKNENNNNATGSNKNCNTKNRVRHSHQHINDNIASNQNQTAYTINVDDPDNVAAGFELDSIDNGQQHAHHHRRKLQRKRKQNQHQNQHHHRQHENQQHQHYHQHRHRLKQQEKQKLKLERQQQNIKDQQQEERNNTTMTLANGATFLIPSTVTSTPSTTTQQFQQNGTSQTSMATQTATFANSATSLLSVPGRVVIADHQHYLNHGSIPAASSSSSQTSLGQQTTTTDAVEALKPATTSTSSSESIAPHSAKAVEATELNIVGVTNSLPSTSLFRSNDNDDLALLDGFYENLEINGFPNQPKDNANFEALQHNAHPVCGTDGRTYHTECQLKKRACRTNNQNLQVAYRGHCKTSCNGVKCLNGLTCVEDHYMIPHCIACKISCSEDDDVIMDDSMFGTPSQKSSNRIVIDPSRAVCGVDGKTYKSICDINRMICKIGRAIAVAYPGPCRADRITCGDINCGPKHKCLVDLLTHEPRCVSCRYKCSRKRHPTALRNEDGKICGVNNRTYNSWCEMRKDSCTTGFFIDVKSIGQCQ